MRTPRARSFPGPLAIAKLSCGTPRISSPKQVSPPSSRAFQKSPSAADERAMGTGAAMKLVLLETGDRAAAQQLLTDRKGMTGVGACIRSLRDVGQTTWKEVLEPLIVFDHVLRAGSRGRLPAHGFRKPRNLPQPADRNRRAFRLTEIEVASKPWRWRARRADIATIRSARQRCATLMSATTWSQKARPAQRAVGYRPTFGARDSHVPAPPSR